MWLVFEDVYAMRIDQSAIYFDYKIFDYLDWLELAASYYVQQV